MMAGLSRMRRTAHTLAFGALLVAAPLAPLQSQEPAEVPSFEVASAKPGPARDNRTSMGLKPGGHYNAANAPLKTLLVAAYAIREYQLPADRDGFRRKVVGELEAHQASPQVEWLSAG
jgi:hypothetical protein